ncbi:MAG: type II toxin-antitoxin system RelE/ParE family toxin [Leptolyngbyaceae cyanobacterium CSU_1_4]|nr:type II toxin-antitoxin system RelE/ParE family toxin [Leptolyngbyaceae cyanobacterium CSU_1_4]
MKTYSLSDEAVQDLEDLCDYIAQTNPKAASQIFDEIRQKAKLLAQFSSLGKSYDRLAPNLRGAIVHDYIIFYYPRTNGIDIARIISGYRDLNTLFE